MTKDLSVEMSVILRDGWAGQAFLLFGNIFSQICQCLRDSCSGFNLDDEAVYPSYSHFRALLVKYNFVSYILTNIMHVTKLVKASQNRVS